MKYPRTRSLEQALYNRNQVRASRIRSSRLALHRRQQVRLTVAHRRSVPAYCPRCNGFLNRQDHGDLPLRHEGRPSTFDELQLRHQHGFLHCLTISLSLHNNGRVNIHQKLHLTNLPSSAQFGTVRTCLCSTTGMSHTLSLRHKPVELLGLLERVAEERRDVHNEAEEHEEVFSSSSFSFSSAHWGGSQLTCATHRTQPG